MTFDEIVKALPAQHVRMLDTIIEEEAQALLRGVGTELTRANLKRYMASAEKDARTYLAEDVTRFLSGEYVFNPALVLSHRGRYAQAWAIASILSVKSDEANAARHAARDALTAKGFIIALDAGVPDDGLLEPDADGVWVPCRIHVEKTR